MTHGRRISSDRSKFFNRYVEIDEDSTVDQSIIRKTEARNRSTMGQLLEEPERLGSHWAEAIEASEALACRGGSSRLTVVQGNPVICRHQPFTPAPSPQLQRCDTTALRSLLGCFSVPETLAASSGPASAGHELQQWAQRG